MTATVTPALLGAIAAAGGTVVNSFPQYRAVRAWLPLDQLEAIADLPEVTTIRPADQALNNKLTTSEGDVAHRADRPDRVRRHRRRGQGRCALGQRGQPGDGAGLRRRRRGDGARRPERDRHLRRPPLLGEGTALLELVSDLAPGASLFFATGNGGQASFASNILALRAAGCDVIVDDLIYFAEPVFQDGIIAQAVNTVSASGALYFSSAGNEGNKNDGTSGVWEGDFLDSGNT